MGKANEATVPLAFKVGSREYRTSLNGPSWGVTDTGEYLSGLGPRV